MTRTLNADSGSSSSTWSYARTAPNGAGTSHTEVVDGLSNHIAYDFVEAGNQSNGLSAQYYETNRSVYQGPETGTPVLSRHTCYNGTASPCNTTLPSLPISQVDTYETLDGGLMHGSTAKFDATYGMQTESDVYDFGTATARGGRLRQDTWAFGYGIVGLPTRHTILDGSGQTAGQTNFSYDGGTVTLSSGVPQHVAVTGLRGNLTSESVFYGTGASYLTSMTYEDTGSVLASTSPNGTSTFSYDPTFVYQTGVQLPTPSSGVVISASQSYDTSYTGLPLTSTDANSQVSRIANYDAMLRPTEADFPDGGKTVYNYEAPDQVGIYPYLDPVNYGGTENNLDIYGRLSRVGLCNGHAPNYYYEQDTCYDGNSNASFVSYPYAVPGWGTKHCSGTGDAYSYDVLGRLTSITRGDGRTVNYTYKGRAAQTTDENGVSRIYQVDGLGRPSIICEISSNNQYPSDSPVTCGTDISGTGYKTVYSYSLATGTTTVMQGVQTRTFQADWLGRPVSITEPESGTTTYSYAYNSTGLQVTRKRPKANQTNPSTVTTTSSQYDSLSRLISVSYDDVTPNRTYTYDAVIGWPGSTQTNVKGRLSLAGVSNAMTIFGYDPTGRIVSLGECVPSNCGSANFPISYSYDLAGNLKSSSDGGGTTSTYAVSPAGELTSLSSSIYNSSNPPNIVSGVQNGPNGPSSYATGNGLSTVSGFDSLGRINGGWVCAGSTSPYCSGGTQKYGFTTGWSGVRNTTECDTSLNQCMNFGYDEFNRLTSRVVTSGTAQNFSYVYDRYGNRWQQNVTAGSGPAPTFSFTSKNQIVQGTCSPPTTSQYCYDAAGNMTADGLHTYAYDAEGNVTAVDGGQTAQYTYDALNHRVQTVLGTTKTEFVFNASGQRVSMWNGANNSQIQGQYYWGSTPVAFYKNGQAHFQHQDWLGTERVRTPYNGVLEGTFTSLPFGDTQTTTSGTDTDPYHFASLDYNGETTTSSALFRQYNSTQGRWMSPDPFGGSYDLGNPQSFNRYAYVMNNPVSLLDPAGTKPCPVDDQGKWVGGCTDPWGLGGGGDGGGAGGCTLDGFDTSCGMINSSWATIQCPDSYCGSYAVVPGMGLFELHGYRDEDGGYWYECAAFCGPSFSLVGGGGWGGAPSKPTKPCNDAKNNRSRFFQQLPGLLSVAQELNVPNNFIVGLSSFESGWFDNHNVALNNLWGLTQGGGNNIQFSSIQAGNAYFVSRVGPYIQGAQTQAAFFAGLQKEGYNSVNPNYYPTLSNRIANIQNWGQACGASF